MWKFSHSSLVLQFFAIHCFCCSSESEEGKRIGINTHSRNKRGFLHTVESHLLLNRLCVWEQCVEKGRIKRRHTVDRRTYRKVVWKLNFVAMALEYTQEIKIIFMHTLSGGVLEENSWLYRENLTSSREKIYRLIVFEKAVRYWLMCLSLKFYKYLNSWHDLGGEVKYFKDLLSWFTLKIIKK